ncbi:hypothetical protein HDV02_002150 [Globomyces sp. JEL0801]|nr:hypothetical protein HDV02_002150 [Globomyces sp. JEL0801]
MVLKSPILENKYCKLNDSITIPEPIKKQKDSLAGTRLPRFIQSRIDNLNNKKVGTEMKRKVFEPKLKTFANQPSYYGDRGYYWDVFHLILGIITFLNVGDTMSLYVELGRHQTISNLSLIGAFLSLYTDRFIALMFWNHCGVKSFEYSKTKLNFCIQKLGSGLYGILLLLTGRSLLLMFWYPYTKKIEMIQRFNLQIYSMMCLIWRFIILQIAHSKLAPRFEGFNNDDRRDDPIYDLFLKLEIAKGTIQIITILSVFKVIVDMQKMRYLKEDEDENSMKLSLDTKNLV